MRQFIKKIGKKTALVVASACIAGTGATMAAFAAIPNSSNGVISACYANSDGALRVIDAQNSATCANDETSLNWGTTATDLHSAVLRITPDPNNATNAVMDPSRSRNILGVHTLELEGNTYLCVKVVFRPEFYSVRVDDQMGGGGAPLNLRIPEAGSDFASAIEGVCGEGYNVVAFLSPDLQVNGQTLLFNN